MIVYKTKSNNSFFVDGISIPSSGLPIENESDRRFESLENLVKLGFIVRVEEKEGNQSSATNAFAEIEKSKSNLKSDETNSKIESKIETDSKIDDRNSKSDEADKTDSKSDKEPVADSSQPLYKIISQNNKKMIIDSEGNKLKDENGKNLKFDDVESAQTYIDTLSL
jgi:DNA mismatch repair ATPase MutL